MEKIMRYEKLNSEHWDKFYTSNINLDESTFCKYVKEKLQYKSILVDVGCGSGRDSFSFANAGYSVIGVDRSQEAISKNNEIASTHNIYNNLSFERIDLGEKAKVKKLSYKILQKSEGDKKSIIVYMRFLLHAIDEVTEEILFNNLVKNLPIGSYFAAEFRTIEDLYKKKTYDDHYRRFINAESFVEKLNENDFVICDFYKGTGLSKFKEEDPYLARIIAKKI